MADTATTKYPLTTDIQLTIRMSFATEEDARQFLNSDLSPNAEFLADMYDSVDVLIEPPAQQIISINTFSQADLQAALVAARDS